MTLIRIALTFTLACMSLLADPKPLIDLVQEPTIQKYCESNGKKLFGMTKFESKDKSGKPEKPLILLYFRTDPKGGNDGTSMTNAEFDDVPGLAVPTFEQAPGDPIRHFRVSPEFNKELDQCLQK